MVNAVVEEENNIEQNESGVSEGNNIVNNNNVNNDLSMMIDDIKNEKNISEFMKKFLKEKIVTIDEKTYIRDNGKLRLVIDDYMEKNKNNWNGS